jgi:hypothetical protein
VIKGISYLGEGSYSILARRFILLVFLTALGLAMSLIITIFALVFITELISWIGKSVLLDLVSTFTSNHINADVPNVLPGIRTSSNNIQRFYSFSPTKA